MGVGGYMLVEKLAGVILIIYRGMILVWIGDTWFSLYIYILLLTEVLLIDKYVLRL